MTFARLQALVLVVVVAVHTADAEEVFSPKFGTMNASDIESDIQRYTAAIQVDPTNSTLYAGRGSAYAEKGESVLALDDFATANALDPQNVEAFRNRAKYWSNQRETSNAIRDLDEAIQLDPDHAPTYVQRGLQRALRHRWEHAFADFDEALRLDPNDATTYFQRALIHGSKHDPENAIADLDTAIRLEPNFALAYAFRGWQWLVQGRVGESIDDFSEVLRIDPRNSSAYWHRAVVRTKQREYAKAISDALTADELNPRLIAPSDLAFIARALHRAADLKLAKRDDANADDPRFAGAFRERGIANRILERWKEALRDLDEAIRLDQSSSLAFVVRGRLWLREREWDRAIDDFDAALRSNPLDESVWSDRGFARAEKKEWAAACDDFTKALQIDPRDHRALTRRGAAWQAQDELDLAIADYDQVICGTPFYVHGPQTRWQDEHQESPEKTANDASSNPDSQLASDDANSTGKWIAAISELFGESHHPDFNKDDSTLENDPRATTNSSTEKPTQSKRLWHTICLDPAYLMAFMNRAKCFEAKGVWSKAIDDYRELIRLAPTDSQAYRQIAWIRATCPDANNRNGEEAIQFAMQAFERGRTVENLIALAAAYAEQGDFDTAVEYQSRARDTAMEFGEKDFQQRRQHYKALEFQQFDADDENANTTHASHNSTGEIESAVTACEQSLWHDAKLIGILANAYAAAGQFDQAITCCEKQHVLTLEETDRPYLEVLELYREGKPFRSNRIEGDRLANGVEDVSIIAKQEMRSEDEIASIHGIAADQLSIAQIRLLSLSTKPEPKSEQRDIPKAVDGVEKPAETKPSTQLDEFSASGESASQPDRGKPIEFAPRPLLEMLEGFVVDNAGVAVKNAKVTLRIIRGKDLFERRSNEDTEKWTASTDEKGYYRFSPGDQIVGQDDDLTLEVEAEGFQPLRSLIDLKKVSEGKLPKLELSAKKNDDSID